MMRLRHGLLPPPREIEVECEDDVAWYGRTPDSNELLIVYDKGRWEFIEETAIHPDAE